MKCFYHNNSDAVGICKNCNKGICVACAVEVGNGLACGGRCEAEVGAVNELIQRNKASHQKTSGAYAQYALWLTLAGMVFIGYGLLESRRGGTLLFALLGLIFLLGAFFSYSSSKKFRRADGSEDA